MLQGHLHIHAVPAALEIHNVVLEQNPSVAKTICEKSILAQRAREAARKARDLTRRKTALVSFSSLLVRA